MPWLFVVTAFIFILFIPTGLYTQHIVVFFIGLFGLGLSFCLFGITATKNWKGFGELRPISWFFRLLSIGIGGFIIYLSNPLYIDVTYFMNKQYEIIQGVPSEIMDPGTNREMVKMITVVINEQSFELIPKPEFYIDIDKLEQKMFKIYYLPNTKWVVSYEVL